MCAHGPPVTERAGDAVAPGFPWARLAFGHLLLGIALIAFLPPWEGYDETAHYAYVQQLADTGRLPVLGESRLSTDVEHYACCAPLHYAGRTPMEQTGAYTYRTFFAAGGDVVLAGRRFVHEAPARPRRYAAGLEPNWQAQHPPLYYAIVAPLYGLTRSWSWAAQLATLRGFSYGLAWAAWCLVALASRGAPHGRAWEIRDGWALTALGLWPVVFPAWFADTARLGNDSLGCLIVAGIWWLNLASVRNGLSWWRAAALGLLLGLGCLTKVFLVPVAAGVLAFWAFRIHARGEWRTGLSRWALTAGLAVAVCGWWYLRCWRLYGSPFVSANDVLDLPPAGGMLHGIAARTSLTILARNLGALLASAAWTPTWSYARPSGVFLVPLVAAMGVAAVYYARAVRSARVTGECWLPLWMVAPMLAGLVYSLVMGKGAVGGVGGYYLQMLLAPLAYALGVALSTLWRNGLARRAWEALTVYALAFGVVTQWAQVMLFSGIFFKSGASKHYQLMALPPWLGIPEAIGRLRNLGYPDAAVVMWLVAQVMICSALLALRRFASNASQAPAAHGPHS
jgi:hypothetical protein